MLTSTRSRWTTWRGWAIEPVVRETLWRLADTHLPPGTEVVGSYWTRTNNPEIDVVCGDRSPVAARITAVGSITWHDEAPFDARDLARLAHHRDRLPGTDPTTTLLAISRTGSAVDGLPVFTPAELITAWPV